MANCNYLFVEFNREIRLNEDRRVQLRERRNDLRDRIGGGFVEVRRLVESRQEIDPIQEQIVFQSQGSYVNGYYNKSE